MVIWARADRRHIEGMGGCRAAQSATANSVIASCWEDVKRDQDVKERSVRPVAIFGKFADFA